MSLKLWPFDEHVLVHVTDPPELASLATLLLAGLTGLRRYRATGSGPAEERDGRRGSGRNQVGRSSVASLGVLAGMAGLLMLPGTRPAPAAFLLPAVILSLCGCLGAWALRINARAVHGHASLERAEILHRLAVLARPEDERAASPGPDGDGLVHQLALLAGLGPAEAAQLRHAATFRHLGRIAVPDAVLHKAGPLDEAERHLLRQVPAIGARLLGGGQSALFERAAEMALGHQECWDGSGYPRGLAGMEIPLAARIAAIADQAAVLLPCGRTEAEPRLRDAAVERLAAQAGRRLDPVLTRLFLDTLRAGPLRPDVEGSGQDVGGGAAACQRYRPDPAALASAVPCAAPP